MDICVFGYLLIVPLVELKLELRIVYLQNLLIITILFVLPAVCNLALRNPFPFF